MKFTFAMPHMMRLEASVQPWEATVTGPEQLRIAGLAEQMGYDQIGVPEHIVIPREHVELSGPHYFHGTAAMGALVGATSTIMINSSVLVLPLHNPLALAKALSTIDWFSGGRITATVGVGWLKREFDLLGVPFAERGRISDEYLAAMTELWTQEEPEFAGRYVSFHDVAFEPKPVRGGRLPIWIGGDADAALRRAARFGSGWWPWRTPKQRIGERLDFIKQQPDYRVGDDFEVMVGLTSRVGEGHLVLDNSFDLGAEEVVDRIGRLADQGVTMTGVQAPPVTGLDAYLDHARWVMEEIKPAV